MNILRSTNYLKHARFLIDPTIKKMKKKIIDMKF